MPTKEQFKEWFRKQDWYSYSNMDSADIDSMYSFLFPFNDRVVEEIQKPSERIQEIYTSKGSVQKFEVDRCIWEKVNSIVEYIDEQHEKYYQYLIQPKERENK